MKNSSSQSREFFAAVEKNNLPVAQKFIDDGIDVNCRDKGGSTALMRASLHCYSNLASILIRAGAEVNAHDHLGKTALHYSVQASCDEIARELIKSGAEINSQDNHGNSPLSDAVFYSKGKGSLIRLLRQHGGDDDLPNKHGVTPLGLAKSIANYELLQYFKDPEGTP